MTDGSTRQPANISEFNTIIGIVFAQLYESFPVPADLHNRQAIASAMGVSSADALPSGRPFDEMLVHSMNWLSMEGYVRSAGLTPYEQLTLTQKGLAALNAVPQGLSVTVGTSLVQATSGSERNWSGIGDLVGGVIGGFTKSVSGS